MKNHGGWAVLSVVVAGVVATAPLGARAAGRGGDVAAAEALFQKAQALMAEGKHTEACPKLAESQRLDPAVGTLIHLGQCYEKTGQTASAWGAFKAAASAANAAGQGDREKIAAARAAALEPKLSKLTIMVPASSETSGLRVERDGVAIDRPSWGLAVPVDPGAHLIQASAAGKKPWTHTAQVPPGGASIPVTVPALESQPESAAAPVAAAAGPRNDATSVADPGAGQRMAGLVVGGLGLAGIGVGIVFGLQSRSKQSDAKQYCEPSNPNVCERHGVELNDEAKSAATIATVGLAAGGALVIGGVVLYLTAPKAVEPKAEVRLAPLVGAGSAGVSLAGVW
jgi:hypothetical protein